MPLRVEVHFSWSCYRKNEADGGQSSFACFRLWGLFSAFGTEVKILFLRQRRYDLKRTLWGESAAIKGPRPLRGATGALDLAVSGCSGEYRTPGF